MFDDIIVETPQPEGGPRLKNLHGREAKDAALEERQRFSIDPSITNEGCWNALVLDDLFDTGATMDAVFEALRTYEKINHISAASAVTWK